MAEKYCLVDISILSPSFEKVIEAKKLLEIGKAKDVSEAVKIVGLSRSTFYKYKDSIFEYIPNNYQKKVILSFMLYHRQGVLADVIKEISELGGNILTINQEIPINNLASVNITFKWEEKNSKLGEMLEIMKRINGVNKASVLAME